MNELDILYRAAKEPIGLLLTTSDFALARQRLYKARAEAMDPALAGLQFRQSPLEGGDLIITKAPEGPRALPGPKLPNGL